MLLLVEANQASILDNFVSSELFISHVAKRVHNDAEHDVENDCVDEDKVGEVEKYLPSEFRVLPKLVGVHAVCNPSSVS